MVAETVAWTEATGNLFKVDTAVLVKAAAGADEEPNDCWFCTGTITGL